jgi:iron complex outermembrane receptor protein
LTRWIALALMAAGFGWPVLAQDAQEAMDGGVGDPLVELSRMSLDELSKVQVTSVSKASQSLSSAPASIYVITREELLRSGVTSVPEALRLAPNMQVTQLTATEYSNGARGFAGAPDAQNFSNKILILIDGRSVYAPLFSGIAYDMQDVLLDDVERIEVISGPGATLWGVNAMNGVINIITRKAEDSAGKLLRLEAGAEEQGAALRYGGDVGTGAYRLYAKWFDRGDTEFADGASAGDDWSMWQTGFRVDLGTGNDEFTVQGDYQRASQSFFAADDVEFSGANLLGRWTHSGNRVKTRVQTYFDRVDREKPPTGIAFDINTWDFELQQSADVGGKHLLVWGIGRRQHDYQTDNNALAFVPDHRTLDFTNIFIQDSITLNDELKLIAGVKFEDNTYSGWSVMPDLRLSWAPNDATLLWLAGSRAVRAPTPFDTEVEEYVGGGLFLAGNPDFEPEVVTAFELGIRRTPAEMISVSASVFYDEYDDLRTVEITPVTLLPLRWGNLMKGSAYGVEAWANIQLSPWWRLSPGFRSVHKRLEFKPGSSQLLGTAQAGNDPSSGYHLKSSMDFGRFTFDAMLRNVEDLPSPAVDEYTELSARFAWRINDRVELAVKGFNLLNETHREYADPQGREIRRNVMAEFRFRH